MDDSPRNVFATSGVLFALFVVLTVSVIAGWTQPIDDAWLSLMAGIEVPWGVAIAEGFHVAGSVPVAFATTLVIAGVFIGLKKWWALGSWVAIVAGAQILSTVTKLIVDRPRPIDALVHESSASYPSGHALVSGAAIGFGFAVLAAFIWQQRSRLFLWVGFLYAVLMSLSRTYLRVHWLTDVVGGFLFGTAIVLFVAGVVLHRRGGEESTVGGSGADVSTV